MSKAIWNVGCVPVYVVVRVCECEAATHAWRHFWQNLFISQNRWWKKGCSNTNRSLTQTKFQEVRDMPFLWDAFAVVQEAAKLQIATQKLSNAPAIGMFAKHKLISNNEKKVEKSFFLLNRNGLADEWRAKIDKAICHWTIIQQFDCINNV